MKYFSDRNNTNTNNNIPSNEFIPTEVWNAICVLFERLVCNNNLAKDFPKRCPDGNCICGVNDRDFYTSLLVTVPNLKQFVSSNYNLNISNAHFNNPWTNDNESRELLTLFTYSVLDAIEYVCKHICNVNTSKYHEYYHHFELEFVDSSKAKQSFIDSVNELFERNNIIFYVSDDGLCKRLVDNSILSSIDKFKLTEIEDTTLSNLIKLATDKFTSPKLSERNVGLEKLWDAFERIKTLLYPENKKTSANRLLDRASLGCNAFKEILEKESKELTSIGNDFQIRHFETSTKPIKDTHHLDYLFYRLYILLSLLIKYI